MLTPQEIQDKKFEKSRFGGYDMEQIDRFLDEILPDYTSLYKENATLKAKMRVLVDKIEEYRAVDEQMRKALYTAQIAANDMTDKAQAESERIIANAELEAQKKARDTNLELAKAENRLAELKGMCISYAEKIKLILIKNIEVVDTIIEDPTSEIDKVAAKYVEMPAPQASHPAPSHVAEQVTQSAREPEPVREPAPQYDAQIPAVSYDTGTVVNEVAMLLKEIENNSGAEVESFFAAKPEKKHERAPRSAVTDHGSLDSQSNMETRMYSVNLGEVDENGNNESLSDTAKIYGDNMFTPRPRFDYSDLRFGKSYDEKDD